MVTLSALLMFGDKRYYFPTWLSSKPYSADSGNSTEKLYAKQTFTLLTK